MTSSLPAWILRARLSANGASDLLWRGFPASRHNLGAGDPPTFPPSVVVQVKALACELPHRLQLPLSRLSLSEIRREVITQGLVAEISGATLWRWLSADALRPWRHRSWIFPRDPDFATKAGRFLISMIGFGRDALSMHVSSSSRRTRKAVFKPAAANNLPWLPRRVVPPGSNTSTSVKAPGPT